MEAEALAEGGIESILITSPVVASPALARLKESGRKLVMVTGREMDDLISMGAIGLMDAIDAFDLTRGVKFEKYDMPEVDENGIVTSASR